MKNVLQERGVCVCVCTCAVACCIINIEVHDTHLHRIRMDQKCVGIEKLKDKHVVSRTRNRVSRCPDSQTPQFQFRLELQTQKE